MATEPQEGVAAADPASGWILPTSQNPPTHIKKETHRRIPKRCVQLGKVERKATKVRIGVSKHTPKVCVCLGVPCGPASLAPILSPPLAVGPCEV